MCRSRTASWILYLVTLIGYFLASEAALPCWFTPIMGNGSAVDYDVVALNQDVVNTLVDNSMPIQMYPDCFPTGDFNIAVKTVSTPFGETLYSGEETEVTVNVKFDLAEIEPNIVPSDQGNAEVKVWLRLLSCNVDKIIFCHPFIDMPLWDSLGEIGIPNGDKDQVRNRLAQLPTSSSPWLPVKKDGTETLNQTDLLYERQFTFNATPLQNDGNQYEFLGHALAIVERETYTYRLDLADSLGNVLTLLDIVEKPKTITVGKTSKIATGLIIGICGTFCLLCFAVIVYYRDHKVMTMAQGGLLGWLTLCSLATIILSFLGLPTRDGFCRYESAFVIPVSMMTNIMIGRLFRVYSTIGTASRLGRGSSSSPVGVRSLLHRRSQQAEEQVMRVLRYFAFSRVLSSQSDQYTNRSSLRRATTRNDTIRLIMFLSLPQIVLQVVKIAIYDIGLVWEYEADYNSRRLVCDNDDARWATYTSLTLVIIQYTLCIYVAWCSRDLPAAFNESSQVFKTAFVNAIVSVMATTAQAYLDLPSTSPDMSTIVWVLFSVSLPMITMFYMVVPKVKRVLNGEEVVVSHLLREMSPDIGTSTPKSQLSSNQLSNAPSSGNAGDAKVHSGPTTDSDVSTGSNEEIAMKSGDALPPSVEKELYRLEEVIESFKDKILSGRPVTAEEVHLLRDSSAILSQQVQRLVYPSEIVEKT